MNSFNPWRWSIDRLFEWIMSLAMLGMGVHLTAWPNAIHHSSFRYVLEVIPAPLLTVMYLIVACLSIAALIANGRWRYGPIVRALSAIVRASIWLQMAIALLKLAPEIGTPSPGLPVYAAMIVGEIVAIFMATADDRFPKFR